MNRIRQCLSHPREYDLSACRLFAVPLSIDSDASRVPLFASLSLFFSLAFSRETTIVVVTLYSGTRRENLTLLYTTGGVVRHGSLFLRLLMKCKLSSAGYEYTQQLCEYISLGTGSIVHSWIF